MMSEGQPAHVHGANSEGAASLPGDGSAASFANKAYGSESLAGLADSSAPGRPFMVRSRRAVDLSSRSGSDTGQAGRASAQARSVPSGEIAREMMAMLSAGDAPRGSLGGVEQRQCLTAFMGVALAQGLFSVQCADMESTIFQHLVKYRGLGDSLPFRQVRWWLLAELALVACSRWHAYLIKSLGRVWQVQVTQAIHERYFSHLTFYHAKGLDAVTRIAEDVPALAHGLAHLCCVLLSVLLRSAVVGAHLAWRAPSPWRLRWQVPAVFLVPLGTAVLWGGVFLRLSPFVETRRQRQHSLEAAHRRQYSRLQEHCEAVASLGGEQAEEARMQSQLATVVRRGVEVLPASWLLDAARDLVAHRLQLPLAALLALAPLRSSGPGDESSVRSLWLLLGHQLQMLVQFMQLLPHCMQLSRLAGRVGVFALELKRRQQWQQDWDSLSWMEFGRRLAFEGATVCTPSGRTLVAGLTLQIQPGEGLLVCGPSGSGKTALARCLGALWPVLQGKVVRPVEGGAGGGRAFVGGRLRRRSARAGSLRGWSNGLAEDGAVVYLPRCPVLPLADCRDLREQVIVSSSGQCMGLSAASMQELDCLIRAVGLDHLSEGIGRDASLENLQRLALARLLWRKPAFAILDGATSALPRADEDALLDACRGAGITLVTLLQREALHRHHSKVLTLEGQGRWRVEQVSAAPREPERVRTPRSASMTGFSSMTSLVAGGQARLPRESSFGSGGGSLRPSVASVGDLLALRSEAGAAQSHSWTFPTTQARLMEPVRTLLDQLRLQLRLGACLRWVSPLEVCAFAIVAALGVCGAWAEERLVALGAGVLRAAVEQRRGAVRMVPRLLLWSCARSAAQAAAVHVAAAAALSCQRRLRVELLRRCIRPRRFLRLAQRLGGPDGGGASSVLAEDVPALTSGTWRLLADVAMLCADVVVLTNALARRLLRRQFSGGLLGLLDTLTGFWAFSDAESFRLSVAARLLVICSALLPAPRAWSIGPAPSSASFSLGAAPDGVRSEEPDPGLLLGHSRLRREAEAVAFANTQARRWGEIDAAWRASFAEQRLQRWQSSIAAGLRHGAAKGLVLSNLVWLSLLYRQFGSGEEGPDACEGLQYMWASCMPLSAAVGVIAWELRDRWQELLRPGGRVWSLIEALEAVEREEVQARAEHGADISFQDVDIWNLEGTKPIAIRLSLSIRSDGAGLVVCGPEGTGKSVVARTLCGLLLAEVGGVRLPPSTSLQLLPCRPYLPPGTLIDNITYPDILSALPDGEEEARLWAAVHGACLSDLMATPMARGEARDCWAEALSADKQQRLAFARLLWHSPRFAVLDGGCAAAMPAAVEEQVLAACMEAGITLTMVLQRGATARSSALARVLAARPGGRRLRALHLEGGGRWTLESPLAATECAEDAGILTAVGNPMAFEVAGQPAILEEASEGTAQSGSDAAAPAESPLRPPVCS